MGVPGSTAVTCGAPEVYRAASALLGEAFAPAADAAATFYTVNTCSWPRTETARLFLPESTVALDHAVQVRDARTGAPLPFVEEAQSNERHRAAGRFPHVPVADVPACGAVRLDIVPVAERSAPGDGDSGLSGDPTVVENDHLRVTVDLREACISSIVDKATGREMVRQDAAVGFNGYVYVYDEYATAGAFNHQSSKTVADDSMHLLASRSTAPPAALVDRVTDATGQTLVYACSPAGTRGLRVRVHLPHHAARIDIENRIDKDATLTKESAFFAFPFALDNPVVHTEATGGVLGTDRETVPGSATHMRAVRRWISLSDGNSHAALATADAPLIQLGGIAIPYVPYPQSLRQEEPATVFSWVHNNIADTPSPAACVPPSASPAPCARTTWAWIRATSARIGTAPSRSTFRRSERQPSSSTSPPRPAPAETRRARRRPPGRGPTPLPGRRRRSAPPAERGLPHRSPVRRPRDRRGHAAAAAAGSFGAFGVKETGGLLYRSVSFRAPSA
ncbi:glycoside hydrolase family 38 C-terminal domain-containing protein [Streptomyces nigra]|uniref:glycoside hydrolase family 38 C-terminal domain-containing protein n=1 Tax=Streptomyces nigra TaxID=1827580 RepID=UPI00381F5B43